MEEEGKREKEEEEEEEAGQLDHHHYSIPSKRASKSAQGSLIKRENQFGLNCGADAVSRKKKNKDCFFILEDLNFPAKFHLAACL